MRAQSWILRFWGRRTIWVYRQVLSWSVWSYNIEVSGLGIISLAMALVLVRGARGQKKSFVYFFWQNHDCFHLYHRGEEDDHSIHTSIRVHVDSIETGWKTANVAFVLTQFVCLEFELEKTCECSTRTRLLTSWKWVASRISSSPTSSGLVHVFVLIYLPQRVSWRRRD